MRLSNKAYRNQIIAATLVLGGCVSAATKVEVAQHIPIDCGPAPAVQKLALKGVEPVAVRLS